MPWIKRNLYFVIIIVVGLGVTGYCGYMLLAALSDNSKAKDDYSAATNDLIQLQNTKPTPSKENIQAAEQDADRLRTFKGEFLTLFSGFPTPPTMDDQQFNVYLQKTVLQFGADATNAGVNLNPGYAFGFSGQVGKLNPPAECIQPWLQELEEIKAILHILYSAKINFLEHIKRPSVSLINDQGNGDDYTQFTSVTNQNGVVTPYRLEFRAFSAEIANVLAGFAASSNCFIVKAPFVVKSSVPLPEIPQVQAPPPPSQPTYRPPPQRIFDPDNPAAATGRGARGARGPGGTQYRPPPQMVPGPAPAAPAAPSLPVTILSEKPLFVTLYIEVVKLKALETNSTATAHKPKTAVR